MAQRGYACVDGSCTDVDVYADNENMRSGGLRSSIRTTTNFWDCSYPLASGDNTKNPSNTYTLAALSASSFTLAAKKKWFNRHTRWQPRRVRPWATKPK